MPYSTAAHQRTAASHTAVLGDVLSGIVADPLDPLAEAITFEIERHTAGISPPAKTGRVAARRRSLKSAVMKALRDKLGEKSAEGTAIRMALIADLALNEQADTGLVEAASTDTDVLLTTAEVAELLEVSRPYVAMLCDKGKLGKVDRTEGGHRRVRRSAVDAYRHQRARSAEETTLSPRQAGIQAGLYDHSDEHYARVERIPVPGKGRKRVGKGAK